MNLKNDLIILDIAVLFSIIGFYFAIKAYALFNRIDEDVLKAKVYLNKNFLRKNFILIFILIVLMFLHTVVEFLDYQDTLTSTFHPIYLLTLTLSIILLACLAFYWSRILIYPKNESSCEFKSH